VFGIATLGVWFTAWVTPLALALWVLLVSIVMLGVGARQTTTGAPA
jgi:hypothetical protein